jgi:hypothetical protein
LDFFISKRSQEQVLDTFGYKKTHNIVVGFLLRRKRDSNPRRCDPQQFSRLPHSTTLPFLLAVMRVQI